MYKAIYKINKRVESLIIVTIKLTKIDKEITIQLEESKRVCIDTWKWFFGVKIIIIWKGW